VSYRELAIAQCHVRKVVPCAGSGKCGRLSLFLPSRNVPSGDAFPPRRSKPNGPCPTETLCVGDGLLPIPAGSTSTLSRSIRPWLPWWVQAGAC